MDNLWYTIFRMAVPQVGYFGDISDYNRRTEAYFAMKRWWDAVRSKVPIPPAPPMNWA